jgi:H/ACA ribonucleoprotein complex subunit 3
MPNTIYIGKKRLSLQPRMVIGQGGEAIVYKIPGGEALKVYMKPDDPMYHGDREAQEGARLRIDEHQKKLPAFPGGLPDRVVAPVKLAMDSPSGPIGGYTMSFLSEMEPLLSYSERRFREQQGLDPNQVVGIFRDLHHLVSQVHDHGVVIGDFNDLNVLVRDAEEAYVVDADSMQFGPYHCRTFTARFVDPLLCGPDKLVLRQPHCVNSDWYAFATMLFQCMLFINPYFGGVHKPKKGKPFRNDARVLNRVTVLSPEVIYPKVAIDPNVLPDELLDYFSQLYEKDQRGVFPELLLENLRWTSCSSCGSWHARATCPACAAPSPLKQAVSVRGTVSATQLFHTSGVILYATHQGGEVRYVYHENGHYKREGDRNVLPGELDGKLRVRIRADDTVFAKGAQAAVVGKDGSRRKFTTEKVGELPIFDANAKHLFWLEQGSLVRDGELGPVTIGRVLQNQTLVWAGTRFGFGFYRAGALVRGLIFDNERKAINDTVPLPPLRGNLIDATCVFTDHLVWFMLRVQDSGVIQHHCYVVNDKAELLAQAVNQEGDNTWLGESIRGHLAIGSHLYVATDSGLTRIGMSGNRLEVEREFPDTEPFVNSSTQLLPGKGGIIAVSSKEIVQLEMQ